MKIPPNHQSTPLRALKHFGRACQLEKTKEELFELIRAIENYQENPDTLTKPHGIIEESADVLIMICKLCEMFGPSGIEAALYNKLERLRGMIDAV